MCEYDLALREDKLIEPIDANGDRTAIKSGRDVTGWPA